MTPPPCAKAFEREEAASIDVVLRALPRGQRMLTLSFGPHSERTQIPPFLHVGAYDRVATPEGYADPGPCPLPAPAS